MKYFLLKGFFVIALLSLSKDGQSQDILDTIFLKNPSFEHKQYSNYADGWTDCGFAGESPYDAHPMVRNSFGCIAKASDGQGFIGLVVRDIETYEAMGQRLYKPLKRGKCYGFSLKLARSEVYNSQSKINGKMSSYTTPARIRIWGGQGPCQKMEMLAETGTIVSYLWKTHYFKLKPIRNYNFLIIEAFYKTPTLFPYNGNVLIDDATNIYEIKCDEDVQQILVALEKKKPQVAVVTKTKTNPNPKANPKPKKVTTQNPKPSVKRHMPELNGKMGKGKTLTIPNLAFEANSYKIPPGCRAVLGELYAFMKENPTLKIELGGHTNNRCDTEYCNKLSELRAKAIADDLVRKGIAANRVSYKGYGKTSPKETNSTKEGRLKNQRVEVKVM